MEVSLEIVGYGTHWHSPLNNQAAAKLKMLKFLLLSEKSGTKPSLKCIKADKKFQENMLSNFKTLLPEF